MHSEEAVKSGQAAVWRVLLIISFAVVGAAAGTGALSMVRDNGSLAVLTFFFGIAGPGYFIRWLAGSPSQVPQRTFPLGPRGVAYLLAMAYATTALWAPPVQRAAEGAGVAIVGMTALVVYGISHAPDRSRY